MWEVLDSETYFRLLFSSPLKRDSSVDTDPSSTACHYEVVLVTFSYSHDLPGVSQADRNPAGIKKGKTFVFFRSSKALTRSFPNTSGPRVSSETHGLRWRRVEFQRSCAHPSEPEPGINTMLSNYWVEPGAA